ncbi:MAG: hypothetical protein AAF611_15930 [Bacteroidota bacterium]
MKKASMKLDLNKRSISHLKTSNIKGGITGTTCELTNKYYNTCAKGCVPGPTFWDCFTIGAGCPNPNTVRVCDH